MLTACWMTPAKCGSGNKSRSDMSALGQKQTYAVQKGMSALPPKADMCGATRNVRFGPKADIGIFEDRGRDCLLHSRSRPHTPNTRIGNCTSAFSTGQVSEAASSTNHRCRPRGAVVGMGQSRTHALHQ